MCRIYLISNGDEVRRMRRVRRTSCPIPSFTFIIRVESVARVLDQKSSSLRGALARIESKAKIHPALKDSFGKLYGFTSDEKGIRHPLLDEPVGNVDETDALFMIGACAAFVSYLINKARAADLLSESSK